MRIVSALCLLPALLASDASPDTPFVQLCKSIPDGDLSHVIALLPTVSSLNYKYHGTTPLLLALTHQKPATVKLLLANGARATDTDDSGSTELSTLAGNLVAQNPEWLIAESAAMAKCLVNWTGYFPFKDMLPGQELLELFNVARFLREKTFMAFDEGARIFTKPELTGMFPRSKLTIDYLNQFFFQDASISIDAKRRYVRNITKLLCENNEFEILGYLVEVTANDIVQSFYYECAWRIEMSYKLAEANLNSAIKLCSVFDNNPKSTRVLVGIFLVPIDNLGLVLSLLPPRPGSEFITRVLTNMAYTAEYKKLEYFSRDKKVVYQNNMILLDYLKKWAPGESEFCMVAEVQLLYSIRLGFRRDWISDDRDAYAIVDATADALFEDICTLNLLNNANQRYARLFEAVLLSQNLELLAQVLPHALNTRLAWHIRRYPYAENMLSLEWRRSLLSQMDQSCLSFGLRMVKFCRVAMEPYPNDEWISKFKGKYRSVLLAEIGDEDRFRAYCLHASSKYELIRAAEKIIDNVNNPIPFIKIILEVCSDRENIHIVQLLGNLKLLHEILLNDNDNFLERLGLWSWPRKDFFETLLADPNLANAFSTANGCRLRRSIRIGLDSFSAKCLRDIPELLEILRVPVSDDAFSISMHKDCRLISSLESPSGCSMDMLDVYAQEPGFLAHFSMVYSRQNAYKITDKRNVTFEDLNPLRFPTFNLLNQWYIYDKESFVAHADWRIVLSFFMARPNPILWDIIRRDKTFPDTLESIVEKHFEYKRVHLTFPSASIQAHFEAVVLPVIRKTTNVRFTLTCSVELTTVHQAVNLLESAFLVTRDIFL